MVEIRMIRAEQRLGNATVVQLEGPRLDAAIAENVKSSLKEISDRGERHIVVDFAKVQFMDSSGLGALVGSLKHMGPGGTLEIVHPCDAVMKVLRLTRMNKVFTVRESLPGS